MDETTALEDYYRNHYDESRRLDFGGSANVERARTLDILERYLPAAPAVVLDVGGGTGAYAFPLARAGYEVHLVDRVAYHVEQARDAADDVSLASYVVGDARELDVSDACADAVLLLGPCTISRSARSGCVACARLAECFDPAASCLRQRFVVSPLS